MHQGFQQTATTTLHLTRMSHPLPPSTPSTQYHTSSRTYLRPGTIDQSIVDLVRHAPRPLHESKHQYNSPRSCLRLHRIRISLRLMGLRPTFLLFVSMSPILSSR